MIPVTYKMVDLNGLDLAEINGGEVPGIYNKIAAAYNTSRFAIMCNWFFAGIIIAPAHVLISQVENGFLLNDLISVKSDDTVKVIGIVPEPVIEELDVTENGTFTPPAGTDGYAPVIVNVSSAIQSLSVSENGTFTPPTGVDGYAPVIVNVPGASPVVEPLSVNENGTFTPQAGVDGFSSVSVNVPEPNYNIVPNWYFKNPSNTRGSSSYQSTGTISAITGWQITNAKIDITSDGILISPLNANDGYFYVALSSIASSALLNKKVTLSMLVDDTEGHVTATINSTTGMQAYLNVSGVAFYIWRNSSTSLTINIGGPLSGMTNKYIKAVKIEFGEESTLVDSHGNLLSTTTPDVEYLRCCQVTTVI